MTLLKAIASGKTTMGEICNATGMDKGMVSKYLHTLFSLHILDEELPVTSHPNARRQTIPDCFPVSSILV